LALEFRPAEEHKAFMSSGDMGPLAVRRPAGTALNLAATGTARRTSPA
jgi:hypothetical protein